MLMLDKFPNGNLGNQKRSSSEKDEGLKNKKVLQSWRFLTGQPAFQKKLRGWVTGPRGELGHRQGRRQDSAESPPLPAEIQKDVAPQFQNTKL